jgi:hypothetical protein
VCRCVHRLRKRIANEDRNQSVLPRGLGMKDRVPSFYTSRSIVNLSGLSVSDPPPVADGSSYHEEMAALLQQQGGQRNGHDTVNGHGNSRSRGSSTGMSSRRDHHMAATNLAAGMQTGLDNEMSPGIEPPSVSKSSPMHTQSETDASASANVTTESSTDSTGTTDEALLTSKSDTRGSRGVTKNKSSNNLLFQDNRSKSASNSNRSRSKNISGSNSSSSSSSTSDLLSAPSLVEKTTNMANF